MPAWLSNEAVLALITAVTGGIAWWFKGWRDDRIKRELTQQAIVESRDAKIEALQGKVESMLMDAVARERETNALRAERLEMDKKLAALGTAMTAALERATMKDGT